MQRGRPIPKLILTAEERETLQGWAQRRKTAQALALRARIVLACAEGKSNTTVRTALRDEPVRGQPHVARLRLAAPS